MSVSYFHFVLSCMFRGALLNKSPLISGNPMELLGQVAQLLESIRNSIYNIQIPSHTKCFKKDIVKSQKGCHSNTFHTWLNAIFSLASFLYLHLYYLSFLLLISSLSSLFLSLSLYLSLSTSHSLYSDFFIWNP